MENKTNYPTVFVVKQIIADTPRHYNEKRYPEFKTTSRTWYRATLEEAEAIVRKLAAEDMVHNERVAKECEEPYWRMKTDVICYTIDEEPLVEEYVQTSNRVYDASATLLEHWDGRLFSDDNCFGINREIQKERFKEGDIVEVLDGDKVKLGIVDGVELQEGKYLVFEKFKDGNPCVDFKEALKVFAPHFPVSKTVERDLRQQHEKYVLGCIRRGNYTCSREDIEHSDQCGCYGCGCIFRSTDVKDYMPDTPLCPKCGNNTVIGDYCFPITETFLKGMRRKVQEIVEGEYKRFKSARK